MYSTSIQQEKQASVNNTSEIEVKYINLSSIVVNLSTVPRHKLDQSHVESLVDQLEGKERFRESAEFADPPVTVFEWEGKYHLVEGWHRLEAYKIYFKKQQPEDSKETDGEIPVSVITGSNWIDFYKAIAVANVGQRPQLGQSNADKRKRVQLALQHPEIRSLSANAAAKMLGISDKTFARIKDTMAIAEDGTVSFEEKSNVLSFPKQKQKTLSGFASRSEDENDSQSSEFRGEDQDYYDEDHSSSNEGSKPERSLPSTPIQVNDVRPERERLQIRIEELEKIVSQQNKELAMLAVVQNERDDYKARLAEMTAIANEQNNAVPLLEEIDKLNAQIQQLSDENKKLKLELTSSPADKEESAIFKPHPVESQIMREMAQACKLLAVQKGSSSLATKIEELIENNFNPDFLQAVLEVSETEKIQEIEKERDQLAETIRKLKEEVSSKDFHQSEITKRDEKIAGLEMVVSEKNKVIEALEGSDSHKEILGKIKIADEVEKLGGIHDVKIKINSLSTLESDIEKHNKVKVALRSLANAVQWTGEEVKLLCEGKTEPIDKLLERLNSQSSEIELPKKNYTKATQIFIEECGTAFNRLMENCFKSLKEVPLLASFHDTTAEVIEMTTAGLVLSDSTVVPWKGLYSGQVQLKSLPF